MLFSFSKWYLETFFGVKKKQNKKTLHHHTVLKLTYDQKPATFFVGLMLTGLACAAQLLDANPVADDDDDDEAPRSWK